MERRIDEKRRAAEHRRIYEQIYGRKVEPMKKLDESDDEIYTKGDERLQKILEEN